MASNHVPSDQMPLQGQNIYTDPSYNQNIFTSTVDRYGTPTLWDVQLNQHVGLAPNNGSNQAWHQGSFSQQAQPYNAFSQSYGTQGPGFQTASPYSYGQFGQQGSIPNYAQSSNVDPNLGLDPNTLRQQQQSPYSMPMRNSTPQTHSGTITPQALQQNSVQLQNTRPVASPYQNPRTTSDMFAQRPLSSANVKPVPVPTFDIPRGKKSGGLYVLDQAALCKATKSIALNKLVNLGTEPFHLPTNRTALPLYTARQSVKELKKAGADNKKLLAKLSLSKPSVAKALKTRAYAGSLGLNRAASDSGSYTESSDDDSEYTTDDEDEVSPLPAARPDEPHEAVRYDVIKATWCPRNPPPSIERIKEGMRDVWEVLGTIQKRWRTDSKAVTDAEEQKKTGELPVLKSRVASQRDLLRSALEAILEHAHPDVIWQLGQIRPFVYLCYQFLANRFHSKDFDGPLSAAIYEVLSRSGTLTSELLEETKAIKALTSMKKHANDKHKALIQKAIDIAVANSEKAKSSTPPRTESMEAKGTKRAATESASRSAADGSAAKKPKPAEGPVNAAKKTPMAAATSKTSTASAGTLPQKKPMATPAPVKARVNQVVNKPSGIFASLNAASKKPAPTATTTTTSKISNQTKPATTSKDKKPVTTAAKPAFSFAQTMASLLKPKEQEVAPVKSEKQLPPETPEEKAKRLRKEARRHLRVTFKPDTALVQIKYFSHDPEEELGHEENFVRHAGDIEGEGRMFKQHKELEVDEDDEDDEREARLRPWRGEPSQVDFTDVPATSRETNYAPYGGGQKLPLCPEKEANIRRENATLMVFYADPRDIPSSPREPLEQAQNEAPAVTVVEFGLPTEKVLKRVERLSAPAPMAMPDLRGLEDIIKQFANPPAAPAPVASLPPPVPQNSYMPPAPAASAPDQIQTLLQALGLPSATNPAPAPVQAPVQQFMPQLPGMPPMPLLPPGMDVNAALAFAMAQAGGMNVPPPPPGFAPPGFPGMWPQIPPQQQDGATHQPQQQSQYNAQPNGGGVKRQRDESNNNEWGQAKKPKHRGDRPHKVLPCKFFQKGTCNKGDNCTYVHDLNM